MSVRRIMGIETEYGILQQGHPYANPMLMSSQIVLAYKSLDVSSPGRTRWDYLDEDPLMDARGFHLDRAAAHPSLLTDDPLRPAPSGPGVGPVTPASSRAILGDDVTSVARPRHDSYDDPGAANMILRNGARLYVDHAHPEYSSPEVTNSLDAVRWDAAGEQVMLRACHEASRLSGNDLSVYKNNVDGKGASYGTHENYLVDRAVPFTTIVDLLTPFLVTRQIFAGAGRVGIGPTGDRAGFQISQRADYMEAEVGLETTLRRPIINTRDEPHSDRERWRRLHLIMGDANLFQVATYLKMGTTSAVLWLLENLDDLDGVRSDLAALRLVDPVAAVQRVSRDLTLRQPLELTNGSTMTAAEIQHAYLAAVRRGFAQLGTSDEPDSVALLNRWESVLVRLTTDLHSCSREVEWVAKLDVLRRLQERHRLAWDHPRLAALDIQWSDMRPERGIYQRLLAADAVEQLVSREDAIRAESVPPVDTRAYFRGSVISRFPEAVATASWDSVVFDVPDAPSLVRVPMSDPHRGTHAHVGRLLAQAESVADLVAVLGSGHDGAESA